MALEGTPYLPGLNRGPHQIKAYLGASKPVKAQRWNETLFVQPPYT